MNTRRSSHVNLLCLTLFSLAALVVGCGQSTQDVPPTGALSKYVAMPAGTSSGIKHIILVIQENRTPDNLFAYARIPGLDTRDWGLDHNGKRINLVGVPLAPSPGPSSFDLDHTHASWLQECNATPDPYKALCAMNGFDEIHLGPLETGPAAGLKPYQAIEPKYIGPYIDLAETYAIANDMFETETSGSFTAHQDLMAGTAQWENGVSLIDFPKCGKTFCSDKPGWGCEAKNATTSLLFQSTGKVQFGGGPVPCLDTTTGVYPTLGDELNAHKVSWAYYTPFIDWKWNAFDVIKAFAVPPASNIVTPAPQETPDDKIIDDINSGKIRSMNWVTPTNATSDHASESDGSGPTWVHNIVDAVVNSKTYCANTLVLVLWDDWGGWYDHVPSPRKDFVGLGFRVPFIVAGAWAKPRYVSSTQYEFGSIIRFIEDRFDLPRLGGYSTDARSASIADMIASAPSLKCPQKPRHHAYLMKQPAARATHTAPDY